MCDLYNPKEPTIKPAREMIGGVISDEVKALDTLGDFQKKELVYVNEISKKEREFQLKYIKAEHDVTITYGFKSGEQWVKNISTSF